MSLLMFLYIRKHEFCSENFEDEGERERPYADVRGGSGQGLD